MTEREVLLEALAAIGIDASASDPTVLTNEALAKILKIAHAALGASLR